MLLSFVGFNVRHFCFWSFLTTGLCVLLLPDGICHELSLLSIWIILLLGTSQQLMGECLLTFVFVVLLGVWLEAGDAVSLFWILDTLGGHCPSWRHFETASIVAMLYFQGRYFLILLQSYVAADVILPWHVLWHVQWFVGFSSFFSLSLQDFTWKNE